MHNKGVPGGNRGLSRLSPWLGITESGPIVIANKASVNRLIKNLIELSLRRNIRETFTNA